MGKILLISYNYFPINSPHSQRWSSLLKLISNKHEIDVICSGREGLSSIETHEGVTIYRVNNIAEKGRESIQKNNKEESNYKKSTAQIIKKIYDNTWKKIYFPDFSVFWYLSADKLAKKLMKKNKYTDVITVSFPFTPHLIGFKLKKHFNFKWHVEVGDPFSLADNSSFNNEKLYKRLTFLLDRKVLLAADKLYFYPEAKYAYEKIFPEIIDKSYEIPIIYLGSTEDYSAVENKEFINLMFIGTLGKSVRNPNDFLKVFLEVIKIDPKYKLTFLGNLSDCEELVMKYVEQFPENIKVLPPVEKQKVYDYMIEADVLVNIANKSKFQLPSKLVDYMSSGKLILNVRSIKNDTSKVFLDKYPNLVDIDTSKEVKLNAAKLVEELERDRKVISKEKLSQILDLHKPENIIKIYDL